MNKINLHIVAALLSAVSFSIITPVVPAQIKSVLPVKLTVQEQQKEADEIKAGIALSIIGATAFGAAGAFISNWSRFKGTGLDVGLSASTAFITLSLFMDKKRAEALQGMAVTAPVLAAIGVGLSKECVSGETGFFAKHAPFGINKIAKSAARDQDKKYAFLLLAGIGTYIATKPYLDRFAIFVSNKASEGYEIAAAEFNKNFSN